MIKQRLVDVIPSLKFESHEMKNEVAMYSYFAVQICVATASVVQ
jgi:hypothetical protein